MSEKIQFNQQGTWNALQAARDWCDQRGISYGSLCGDAPVALLRGDFAIAKWRNLSGKEKAFVDGKMTGEFREGPVTIEWFRAVPPIASGGSPQ